MKLKKLFIWAAMGLSMFNFYSCSEPASPFGQTEITLTALDASCTEVWLELKFSNLAQPANVAIQKDGKDYLRLLSLNRDTLLIFEDLEPSTNYSFRAIIRHEGNDDKISNTAEVRTMDTTSHSFTWETFTFGEVGSSTLYDVAIIDENNIWAVGEIYMNDSLGNPDPHQYNLIKWNGIRWITERVYFTNGQGQTFLAPMKSIYAFDENDIWIGLDQIIRWNGNDYQSVEIPNSIFHSWINKIWGTESNNIYIVGNGGNIAHYNGTSWKKIESGTSSIINDVWGTTDKVGKLIVYCPVSSFFEPGDKKILRITNNKVDSFLWNIDVRLYSAWATGENFLFVCGEGAFENKFGYWNQINLPAIGMNSVRGNNINDIFIVGDYGFISHYNGVNWKVMSSPNDKGYSKVNMKGDVVVICGQNQGYGIIEIGKRN